MSTYGIARRQMREAGHRQSISGNSNMSFDFCNPLNMSTETSGNNQVFIRKLNRLDKAHLARTIENVVLKRHS